ncbi:GntR family transcriptional regulator [Vagococcus zengguangii]|uniref:GntR family transcriptional regulator n=1 Tax=Vagococcus zengguangii TaxID=2571750 RepID=A0A4D7CRH8_9ENTE|nr:GntR family transcriptional regulator [Vagococcus zengguangii]QCI85613.1 GntR family transcriptional regulator [Vagococcus zengguangii]TLG79564.1 GntR family transcriptional regulator [Vagococcus zengguangii]
MLKYEEIAHNIERYIREHNLRQNDKLPSTEEMMNEYQVSKSTIVKALSYLQQKGMIYQLRGSGIFVRRTNRKGYINLFENQGFTSLFDYSNVSAKVLAIEELGANEEVAESLNIAVGEPVLYVKRLRYIEEQIFCVEESYFNKMTVPYVNKEIAEQSLYQYLTNVLKVKIGYSDKFLHVIKLSEQVAQLLELEKDDPALLTEEIFHKGNGEPFNFSKITYHYVNSQFYMASVEMK